MLRIQIYQGNNDKGKPFPSSGHCLQRLHLNPITFWSELENMDLLLSMPIDGSDTRLDDYKCLFMAWICNVTLIFMLKLESFWMSGHISFINGYKTNLTGLHYFADNDWLID